VNLTKLLPLVTQLGSYLKLALDYYADAKAAGLIVDADSVAIFLRVKLDSWDPQVNGKPLLDDATRNAAARFLAGVAVNFVGAP
jgi:hypothetical protein